MLLHASLHRCYIEALAVGNLSKEEALKEVGGRLRALHSGPMKARPLYPSQVRASRGRVLPCIYVNCIWSALE